MNFLFAAPPIVGHVNPLLSVVRMLIARGHTATMITGAGFRPAVESSGAAFEALPSEVDTAFIDRSVPVLRAMQPGAERLLLQLTTRFIDAVPAQHATLDKVLSRGGFDAVVAGSMFFGALPTMMRRDTGRTKVICCGMTFLTTERDDEAPICAGIPPAITFEQRVAALAARREADAALWLPLMERMDARLAEVGAGPAGATFGNVMAERADLFLQPSVPGFEYPRAAMPAGVRFVGPLPIPPSDLPDPDWIGDLDDGRRVVLVTQGTVANEDLEELIAPTLTALADASDLLVVVSTGGRDPSRLRGPLPANARVARFLPFDRMLRKVDALVTNAGFGTVSAALAAGVPIVAAGQTEDKAEISARIEWSFAGIDLRTSRPTPTAVRHAVQLVLDGPGCRASAARLARECLAYDASVLVPRLVEHCARRVKRPGLMIPAH